MNPMRWLLWLCLSRLGFALINTAFAALIPTLRADWNMSAGQAGLIQSAWHGGYLVSLVAASALLGRCGAKRTFLGMGYAACAGALLFALCAHSFTSAFILYGLAGLCAGGSYVPGLALIGERFSSSARGRAMGYYIAAASLGYALGLIGSSALASRFNPQAGFLLAACGTLAGQAVALFALRGTPNLVAGPHHGASRRSLLWLWRSKPARLLILSYGMHAWELLGMWAWLPAYLSYALTTHHAVTLAASGALLAALAHAVSIAGSLLGGTLSDRWGRARVILLLSLASACCALLFGWAAAAPVWLLGTLAIVFNCTAIGDSAIYSAALTEVVPARHLATAYSVRSVLGFGMGALSPSLMGWLLDINSATPGAPGDAGWRMAWCGLGAIALAGPLMSYRLHRMPVGAMPSTTRS